MISKVKLNELHKQQKAGVRAICHAKNNIPTDPLYKKLKILKLPDLIKLEMCKLRLPLEVQTSAKTILFVRRTKQHLLHVY